MTFLLVIILAVNKHCVFAHEQKRQPPIAAHVHRPVSGEISFQRMQIVARRVHILGAARHVQRGQPSQSRSMFWLDARLAASLGKSSQSLVYLD